METESIGDSGQCWARQDARCLFLLVSLLGLVLFYPLIPEHSVVALIVNAFILISGTLAIGGSRSHTLLASGIAATQLLLGTAAALRPTDVRLEVAATGMLFVFYSNALVTVLAYVVRGRQVTTDKLYGAVCLYLLIGLTWSILYHLLLLFQPGALVTAANGKPDAIYFSFVTLCTVGYGDQAPAAGMLRSMALLESIAGEFYLAILVSRLVNAIGAQRDEVNTLIGR